MRAPLSLRLWHRILSAGTGPAADLRGWDRLIRWQAWSPAERRNQVRRFLRSPARAALEARQHVREFGDEVRAKTGLSRARQFGHLWWLKMRHGVRGQSYLVFQLYRPDRYANAGRFVQESEGVRLARFLKRRWPDDQLALLDRKPFEELCRRHGLPTLPILMEIRDGGVVESGTSTADPTGDDPAVARLPARDIFTKPVPSMRGEGAARWLYDGAGGWVGRDGQRRTADELLAELAAATLEVHPTWKRRQSVVVLELARNHADLLPLTPGGLCTVRMLTTRMPGEAPELCRAVYKMPMGDEPADNFRFGGVVAPVDVVAGRLGPAIFKVGRLLTTVTEHPGTGARIDGTPLPHWRDAVALALRAHSALPTIGIVGWDIAILDRGPVVIEGNAVPSAELVQEPSGEPLGDTSYVACMNAHLRAELGFD